MYHQRPRALGYQTTSGRIVTSPRVKIAFQANRGKCQMAHNSEKRQRLAERRTPICGTRASRPVALGGGAISCHFTYRCARWHFCVGPPVAKLHPHVEGAVANDRTAG